jgi:hypothetical protein
MTSSSMRTTSASSETSQTDRCVQLRTVPVTSPSWVVMVTSVSVSERSRSTGEPTDPWAVPVIAITVGLTHRADPEVDPIGAEGPPGYDPLVAEHATPDLVGPNAWMVDEMYEQYLSDPSSVSDAWQDFFADYKSDRDPKPAPSATETAESGTSASADSAREAKPASRPSDTASADSAREAKLASRPNDTAKPASRPDIASPIRGVGARIVENMERSLSVPTATSYRQVPAKLLEVNRRVING